MSRFNCPMCGVGLNLINNQCDELTAENEKLRAVVGAAKNYTKVLPYEDSKLREKLYAALETLDD